DAGLHEAADEPLADRVEPLELDLSDWHAVGRLWLGLRPARSRQQQHEGQPPRNDRGRAPGVQRFSHDAPLARLEECEAAGRRTSAWWRTRPPARWVDRARPQYPSRGYYTWRTRGCNAGPVGTGVPARRRPKRAGTQARSTDCLKGSEAHSTQREGT